MSNMSAIQAAALPVELADFISQHAIPGQTPTMLGCMQALTDVDVKVFDYCGKIEALMKAVMAVINTSPETEASDPIRHLVRLAEQRAALCREEVTCTVEEAGLQPVTEDTAVI